MNDRVTRTILGRAADRTGDGDSVHGTLEDLDRLIVEAHARGLRLILDLVPSHTSDRHPWFQASRSSRGDLKRDWYLRRDPAPDGGPPSGSRNPVVLDAMEAVMRFWLDRGVDGFRVDVIHNLLKDEAFRDDPPNPDFVPGPCADPYFALLYPHSTDPSEVHGLMRWFRYYGDEFGMQDAVLGPEHLRDPWGIRVPGRGRDPGRTPMRWDATGNAGFTTGVPWLPVGDDARAVNVELQRRDERSILTLYRRLLELRGGLRALTGGGQRVLSVEGDVVGYLREDGDRRVWVALDLGSRETELATPVAAAGVIALATGLDREGEAVGRSLRLRGDEGCVVVFGGGDRRDLAPAEGAGASGEFHAGRSR